MNVYFASQVGKQLVAHAHDFRPVAVSTQPSARLDKATSMPRRCWICGLTERSPVRG